MTQKSYPRDPIEVRLRAKYLIGENGCWNWIAANVPKGYGVIYFQGKQQYAHRVSYQIYVGEIPEGLFILHRCDNPKCVNPKHLFPGTAADNTADMMVKGRCRSGAPKGHKRTTGILHGEENGFSKLMQSEVEQIRELYKAGAKQVDLAAKFGVNQPHISRIVRGEAWAH